MNHCLNISKRLFTEEASNILDNLIKVLNQLRKNVTKWILENT
ncbi:13862_t:CDS:2 [Cetraspora pellucida]|uniref:13862_t:CDS:1 n=1 Tax=Cetraspora pellucida TaxID=1433469 RepID=A0A9N9BQD5_9GLOM|nr:13862_t:CDS:2 [Cetraspora pellucida]